MCVSALLTQALAGFLSNVIFSFCISDAWTETFGFKFPGGQFLISALCFVAAAINTNQAMTDPAIMKYDVVRQKKLEAEDVPP